MGADMSEPFLAEIQIFGFNFAPRGWALCDGQILPINQNQSLFSLLGTTYGGDGETTFGLPDLRGRGAMHEGSGPGLSPKMLGQKGGAETVTLAPAEIAAHSHALKASSDEATSGNPGGNVLADLNVDLATTHGAFDDPTDLPMNPDAVGLTGGGQSHTNVQPFLTLNFCIALQGLFPSRN